MYSPNTVDDSDLHLLEKLTLHDTQLLLDSDDNSKHKIVYIGGFLVHEHGQPEVDSGECLSSELVTKLG